MFRSTTIEVTVSDDSTGDQPTFGPRKMVAFQTLDQESFSTVVKVGPADVETQIAIAPVTSGCFFKAFSDYPVRIRLNGPAATQFTMKSNNNPVPQNVGAPLPDICEFGGNVTVSSVYLAPIAGATQTARVTIVVTGDPDSAYQ